MSTQNLENTITLSEAFYKEIDEHRIPAEREVIATLAHAPGLLHFYSLEKLDRQRQAGVRARVWPSWNDWPVGHQRLFG